MQQTVVTKSNIKALPNGQDMIVDLGNSIDRKRSESSNSLCSSSIMDRDPRPLTPFPSAVFREYRDCEEENPFPTLLGFDTMFRNQDRAVELLSENPPHYGVESLADALGMVNWDEDSATASAALPVISRLVSPPPLACALSPSLSLSQASTVTGVDTLPCQLPGRSPSVIDSGLVQLHVRSSARLNQVTPTMLERNRMVAMKCRSNRK